MKDKIKELYIGGYNSKEISLKVCKTESAIKQYISRNLKEFRNIHNENRNKRTLEAVSQKREQIKNLYLKGYNSKEISDIMCLSHGYIRNLISKHFREYRDEHKIIRDNNKSIKKAVKTMNNSYINNTALLKFNRQSYIYNKNNNLVFDESRGSRPEDLPKTFYKKL